MAMQSRTLSSFGGMRQDRNDYISSPDTSPDACNMDTRDGCLTVAKGFSPAVANQAPSGGRLSRLYGYIGPGGLKFLACAGASLYACDSVTGAWTQHCTLQSDPGERKVDFLPVKIGAKEYVLIAHGGGQMFKWDGVSAAAESFGSAQMLSNAAVNFVEPYYGRLFAAGDAAAPARLYWSKTPGDDRTIEDWRSADASADVSGGFADIGTDSDPITGLMALSNQLLIFKRDSLYRLLGDRPTNYRILPVDAAYTRPAHTACVRYADRLYFLTATGLCFFDGQTVRRPNNFRALCRLLAGCSLDACEAVACGDMLYFAVRESDPVYNDAVIEYDLMRGTFMVRRGFTVAGMTAVRGTLYVLTGEGKLEKFDDSPTYDGQPIRAWWETPRFDLGNKHVKKALGELACTGHGDPVRVTVKTGGTGYPMTLTFPNDDDSAAETILRGEGRVFRLRLENIDGGHFTLDAGVTLRFDAQLRPE